MPAATSVSEQALEALRTAIADAATFRAWVGAADRDAALAHINPHDLNDPVRREYYAATELTAMRPFAVVSSDETDGERVTSPATFARTYGGRLLVLFESNVAIEHAREPGSAQRDHLNRVGQIMTEVVTLGESGGDEYLATTAPRRMEHGLNAEEGAEGSGRFAWSIWQVPWGEEGAA